MTNLLNGRTVYLAGAVEVSDDPASWRDNLALQLSQINGLRIWDPLIKPEWCVQITGADQRKDLVKFNDGDLTGLSRNREIREVCLRLVSACDFIICMLGGRTVGTFEELAHAALMNKPVLFIGNIDSCWRFAQFVKKDKIFFNNQNDLVQYLINIDSGSQKVDSLSWIFLPNNWVNHVKS